jgi:SAM-dependent methyltransferase
MRLISTLTSWRVRRAERVKYCTKNRLPFFELAAEFLPDKLDAIVLDIGPGDATFARHLLLARKYTHLYLLDANAETIDQLRQDFPNTLLYRAPERLPFEDQTVSYIHCSHLIEHLRHEALYTFLVDIDRVLSYDGVVAISGPMMTDRFYYNLSHVKPYPPEVLMRYLCDVRTSQASASSISRAYHQLALVYQYNRRPVGEGLGGKSIVVDFLLKAGLGCLALVGICRYERSGYTLILQKHSGHR